MFESSSTRVSASCSPRISPVRSLFSRIRTRPLRQTLAWNLAAAILILLLVAEARTSWLESRLFSAIAGRMTFDIAPGPSRHISFPGPGPYDERLGYTQIPDFVRRAQAHGYSVSAQARDSSSALILSRAGVYPIYHEKPQAGLEILDRDGRVLRDEQFPLRVYRNYSEIPGLAVNALLFMENRAMFDPRQPRRNPAVEWARLSHAVLDYGLHALNRRYKPIGASTLATQLEKIRHSPEGRTHSPGEKLDQMLAASLRAYQDGPETLTEQKRIVRDYFNSLPLAATAANGEVNGLGDGLWAWYGADFGEVNRLLNTPVQSLAPAEQQKQGLAFREVLSLLIATRSPQRYLGSGSGDLAGETDRNLRALCAAGIISPDLRNRALMQHPPLRLPAPPAEMNYVENKANNLVRENLCELLGVNSTYTLDRLDLAAQSTIDAAAQQKATALLGGLGGYGSSAVAALRQPHLLAEADPRSVIYSFTLYERGPGLNLLRIQTDTLNEPLNINQGTKLELGSTAKLRTLILYLQIIERLHAEYASQAALRQVDSGADPLTAWAIDYLSKTPDKSLRPMLEAALDRKYSASPAEGFFTAGGLHQFDNFERSDNGRILPVREAFERSVNLVFIRLMRDIERYYLARLPGTPNGTNLTESRRRDYLVRFADQEGQVYLERFYRKYEGQTSLQAMEALGHANTTAPGRLAVIYRSVWPNASAADFAAFIHRHVLAGLVTDSYIQQLYDKYAPGNFNLQDRGYLAGIHPLELWLLSYKEQHPKATLSEVIDASADERQQAYAWLFATRHEGAQDLRIRILQEQDAFQPIAQEWKRLGYPFETLVPSYATAIGVSGDTPAALAELMGIIAGGGIRYPSVSIRELRFAAGTPVATVISRPPAKGDRVLSQEIAAAVRAELIAVVERGTARRASGGIRLPDGRVLALGGKTGTGDNRVKIYAGRGYLVGSRITSRTAVFAFLVGDRFFGTVMAFVPGRTAGNYEFTSALAVQVFKDLEPALKPLLQR